VIALLVFIALAIFLATPRVQSLIASTAAATLGRRVKFSTVSLAVYPAPAVRLKGIEVAEDPDFGTTPFLTIEQADVRLRLRPVLSGRVELDNIVLTQPHITVIRHADGRLNLTSFTAPPPDNRPAPTSQGGAAAGTAALRGIRVQVADGVLSYVSYGADGSASHYGIEDLDLTLTDDATATFDAHARLPPGDLVVQVTDGTVALRGAPRVDEAAVRARVTLESRDITSLVALALGPAPAIGGRMRGTLAVAGTLAKPSVSGAVDLSEVTLAHTNPQCPQPQRRTLTFSTLHVDAAWDDGRLIGRPATIQLGDGTITTNLVVTLDPSVRIDMEDVAITAFPIETLLEDFLCAGYAVSGPLDLTGALSLGSVDAATTFSSVGQLRIGPGKVIGAQALALLAAVARVGGAVSALLNADLPWSLFSSPLDFDSITATYQNNVIQVQISQ